MNEFRSAAGALRPCERVGSVIDGSPSALGGAIARPNGSADYEPKARLVPLRHYCPFPTFAGALLIRFKVGQHN
jgi:hypothetical protein